MEIGFEYIRELSRRGVEVWTPAKGFSGYEVSNLGRVRSVDRVCGKNRKVKGKILKAAVNPYPSVTLMRNGQDITCRVHRLVLCSFCPGEESLWVNHIDETKTNNCLYNLEWVTPIQNANHGTRNLRCGKGNEKPVEVFDLKGTKLGAFRSMTEAAGALGISFEVFRKYTKGMVKKNRLGIQIKYLENSNVCQPPLT